jgi:SAM-dependent methyltransferase
MADLKSALKAILPGAALKRWRLYKFNQEQKAARGQSLEEVFTGIYENNVWDREDGVRYHSGPGSRPDITAAYEDYVARYINGTPSIETLVDIGCGDFQVSNRILGKLNRPIQYIGCDIAANVVAYNQDRFGVDGRVRFQQLNAATGEIPSGDLVTIREVFQHLSNDLILSVLKNLRGRIPVGIITESVFLAPTTPNVDLVSGYRTRDGLKSGVYLDLPPFNLAVRDRFETATDRPDEVLRTLRVPL